jgi:hypothetical protein
MFEALIAAYELAVPTEGQVEEPHQHVLEQSAMPGRRWAKADGIACEAVF